MEIKAQDGNIYHIWEFSINQHIIKCKDSTKDKRKNFLLGKYKDRSRATEVFKEMLDCRSGYYEMPIDPLTQTEGSLITG